METLWKNAVYNVLKTVSSLIFPLITFSYASHKLLADGMGRIEFSKSYVAYFSILAMLGVTHYGTREGARIKDDRKKLSRLAQELLMINGLGALVAYLLLFASIWAVPVLRQEQLLLFINSISILLNVLGMEWLYNSVEDYRYVAFRSFFFQIISLFLMFLFVKGPNDVWKYALIQVIAVSGNQAINLFHARKYISFRPCPPYQAARHIRPILILFLMTISIQVFTHLDATMLGFLQGQREVGLYSAASKTSSLAAALLTSLTLVMMPRISYELEQGQIEQVKKRCRQALNLLLILGIPAMLGLAFLSRDLILLLSGEGFVNAVDTTRILSARVLLVPINSFIVIHLFIPMGKERENLVSTGCAAVLNFIINLFLIPLLAQNGAAIATVAAELVELVLNLIFLSKLVSLSAVLSGIWQYLLAAIPVVLICLFMQQMISSELWRLILSVTTAVPVYFGMLLLLKNEFLWEGVHLLKGRKM